MVGLRRFCLVYSSVLLSNVMHLCFSDGLPCSCDVKGVGIGECVKDFRGKIIICCRFSDVSILEFSNRKKICGEGTFCYEECLIEKGELLSPN